MLHALDADHIMAVTSLVTSGSKRINSASTRRTLAFSASWAAGHGTILVSVAALLAFLNYELPPMVARIAEISIGILLVVLGIWILRDIATRKLKLTAHRQDDIAHVHLVENGKQQHNHKPVLVGMVHGLAGSAPVLALIPVSGAMTPWHGIGYIVLFSLGVLTSMLLFGLFFGRFQRWIAGLGERAFDWHRSILATISIGFGLFWVAQGSL